MKNVISLREWIDRSRSREFGALYRTTLEIRELRPVAVRLIHDRKWKVLR